jgi:hypothetical protein
MCPWINRQSTDKARFVSAFPLPPPFVLSHRRHAEVSLASATSHRRPFPTLTVLWLLRSPVAQMHWNNTRQGAIDKNALYYLQLLPPLGDDDAVRITGDFQPVLYSSFQLYPNPLGRDAAASIRDREINPRMGKNPYRDPTTTPEEVGSFEIWYTKTGNHGLPNEQKANITVFGMLVYRLYKATPEAPLPLDRLLVAPKLRLVKISDKSTWDKDMQPCSKQVRATAPMTLSW